MGAKVTASRREKATATEMVTPNSKKNLPMMPCMKATGRKMAMTALEMTTTEKVISRAPYTAAWTNDIPPSRWREMFSSTTMASSTTMPITSEIAISVIVLSVKPRKYMTRMVPPRAVGMARTTLSVELQEPRKSQHTIEVSRTAMARVRISSWIVSSMNLVVS